MKNQKQRSVINYKKIKRDILKQQTGLDSRFVSKTVKSKKVYSRKEKHKSSDH